MLKPTRAVLALAAGSLVLGLGGLGGAAAAADGGNGSSRDLFVEPDHGSSGKYEGRHYTVGKVVSRGSLTVRSLPTTDSRSVGKVKSGQRVAILCKVKGQKVDGNDIWYRLLVKEHEDSHKDEKDDKKEDEKENGGEDEERQEEREDQRDEQDAQEEQDQREEDAAEDADEQTDEEAEGDVEDELAEDSDEEAGLSAKRASSSKDSSKKAWVSARYVKNLDRVGSCD
ncbi:MULTISPECIES: SH3 domain-containing protein [unclassified Streptomyces]|uniref:SH3 domain-containing protein n=1 Tax=unclassified Streptomyces TaxID=2593676 RepID=UPI00368264B1